MHDVKKLPITGMSPMNGILLCAFETLSEIRPPSATVWPFLATIVVDADRTVVVGPAMFGSTSAFGTTAETSW